MCQVGEIGLTMIDTCTREKRSAAVKKVDRWNCLGVLACRISASGAVQLTASLMKTTTIRRREREEIPISTQHGSHTYPDNRQTQARSHLRKSYKGS